MKHLAATILVACAELASFAHPGALEKAWLKGTTDKSPIAYKSGEPIVFTIEPQRIRGEIPAGEWCLGAGLYRLAPTSWRKYAIVLARPS